MARNKMISKADFAFQLEHNHGGGSLVVVQDLGDEMFRVVRAKADELDMTGAFLAWGRMMKRELRLENPKDLDSARIPVPLNPTQLEQQKATMAMLESGQLKAINQRLVKA